MSSGSELEKLVPLMLTGEFICIHVRAHTVLLYLYIMHVQYIMCVKYVCTYST